MKGISAIGCWIICIASTVPHSIGAQSTTEQEYRVKQKADSLLRAGDLQKAALAYEKVLFLLEEDRDSLRTELLFQRARCFQEAENYSDAYFTLQRIDPEQLRSSLRSRWHLEKILMAYMAGKYNLADSEWRNMPSSAHNKEADGELYYLKILIQARLNEWERVPKMLASYCGERETGEKADSLIAVLEDPGFRSRRTARALSFILPGLGQIYGGSLSDGLLSTALTGGTVFLGVNRYIHGYELATFLSGTQLFWRFYTGGVKHSGSLVQTYNAKRKGELIKALERYLLKMEMKTRKRGEEMKKDRKHPIDK